MIGAFLLQVSPSDYSQWGIAGAIVLLVLAFLGFCLRALPSWKDVKSQDKEVKLAEIAVREKEAEARAAQAVSFGQLSEVLNNVAVKQHKETEALRIMQRANSDSGIRMEEMVNGLVDSVEHMTERLDSLERKLQGKSHGTKAQESPTA